MTHYIRHGNRYQVTPNGALDVAEILALGTYKVGYVEMADDYFLEKIEDFAEPVGKVYGDLTVKRDRILNTFFARPSATGVMLAGEKGSGKTLLAKLLSLQAQERGIPTIVINQPWHGDTFNAFIQSIEQECVVVFDEFEKVYNKEQQEKLLTLLDGVFPSKKLFVLTCNDKWRVDEHMRNRPGRIFYRLDFGGLDSEFIRDYCDDLLTDKDRVDEVVRVAMLFSRFNFDILKALVEEMNRYDESAEESLKMLNAKPELGEKLKYAVSLFLPDGQMVPENKIHDRGVWRGNPLTDEIQVYFNAPRSRRGGEATAPNPLTTLIGGLANAGEDGADPWDAEDEGMKTARFLPADLRRVNAETGVFEFENREGLKVTMRERIGSSYDYSVVY